MATFVEVTLENGNIVYFQSTGETGVELQGGPLKIEKVDQKTARLETLASEAASLCTSLRERLSPDEITVELKAGINGKIGWFFAESNLDTSITITATWRKSTN